MITTTLTLQEIYNLDLELAGFIHPETNEILAKGLLNQELSLVTKYDLSDLYDIVQTNKKRIDSLRDELIKKLGEPGEEGQINLPMMIDKRDEKGKVVFNDKQQPVKELNPKYVEFDKELSALLGETKEINVAAFDIKDFSFKTTERYPVFFKLLRDIRSKQSAN